MALRATKFITFNSIPLSYFYIMMMASEESTLFCDFQWAARLLFEIVINVAPLSIQKHTKKQWKQAVPRCLMKTIRIVPPSLNIRWFEHFGAFEDILFKNNKTNGQKSNSSSKIYEWPHKSCSICHFNGGRWCGSATVAVATAEHRVRTITI